jgi:hypothetical protein
MKKLFNHDSEKKNRKKKFKKRRRKGNLLAKRTSFDKTNNQEKNKQDKNKLNEYKNRLKSSQFRILNEYLYTKDSQSIEEYFSKNQEEFDMVKMFYKLTF